MGLGKDRSVNVTSQPFVNPNEVTFVRRHAVLQALHAAVIILLVKQRKSQGNSQMYDWPSEQHTEQQIERSREKQN